MADNMRTNRENSFALKIGFVAMAITFFCFVFFAHGQSEIVFAPNDIFEIPMNNGSISFAVNGTYEQANLENGVWSFVNLHLANSEHAEKVDLKVSAKNSIIVITSCRIYYGTFAGEKVKGARLTYEVVGEGTQIFDLGLDTENGDWSVIRNGEWPGKNHGWSLSPSGIVTVTNAVGRVTLAYYGFPVSFLESRDLASQNVWEKHSVFITTVVTVFVTVIIAIAIRFRNKKKGVK
jgi:hypothetical protein